MVRYKILPHTADLRLKAYGKDYEELFQNAALGLAHILCRDVEKKAKLIRGFEKISVKASGPPAGGWETLLVNFLNEILTLSNINKKAYLKVKVLKFSPTVVEAQIFGIPVEEFNEDVKAVSYHEVRISKNDERFWETTLTIDI